MATQSVSLPGLDDLFISSLQLKNPERTAQAAFNANYPLIHGLAAVGELLWWSAQNDDFGLDGEHRNTIGDIGMLVKAIATQVELVRAIGSNADYHIREGLKNAEAEFVDIADENEPA